MIGQSKKSKSNTIKTILLLFFITIVVIAIMIVFVLNSNQEPIKETPIPPEEKETIKKVKISTKIFNQSNIQTQELLIAYFANNPSEEQNSKKLSESLRDCKNINAEFIGDTPEFNGHLYIEDLGGETCFISYRSDLTIDCNYTKEQTKMIYRVTEENGPANFAGPAFYITNYLEIQMRILGDVLKEKVNETYEKTGRMGNLTLSEDLMTENIERKLKNLETGEEEIVKCLIY